MIWLIRVFVFFFFIDDMERWIIFTSFIKLCSLQCPYYYIYLFWDNSNRHTLDITIITIPLVRLLSVDMVDALTKIEAICMHVSNSFGFERCMKNCMFVVVNTNKNTSKISFLRHGWLLFFRIYLWCVA